jgi:hypothetical protein
VLAPRLSPTTLKPGGSAAPFGVRIVGPNEPSSDYYRQVVEFAAEEKFLSRIGFCVRNVSATTAVGVVAKSTIPKVEGVRLLDRRDRPRRPERNYSRYLAAVQPLAAQLREDPNPEIQDYATHWQLTIPLGRILPRATVWSSDVLYIGSERDLELTLPIELFAENLPAPQQVELDVRFEVEARPMQRADLPMSI